jgi:hypothetical protein
VDTADPWASGSSFTHVTFVRSGLYRDGDPALRKRAQADGTWHEGIAQYANRATGAVPLAIGRPPLARTPRAAAEGDLAPAPADPNAHIAVSHRRRVPGGPVIHSVSLVALRDIPPTTEILISYGNGYRINVPE